MPRRFGEHAMIGPGGVARVPSSETVQLTRAIELIEKGETERAVAVLKQLQKQVAEGYHRNPGFRIVGVIGDDVHSVAYRHVGDHKFYRHDFESGSAHAIAVERNGKRDILITSMQGVPLWDEF